MMNGLMLLSLAQDKTEVFNLVNIVICLFFLEINESGLKQPEVD